MGTDQHFISMLMGTDQYFTQMLMGQINIYYYISVTNLAMRVLGRDNSRKYHLFPWGYLLPWHCPHLCVWSQMRAFPSCVHQGCRRGCRDWHDCCVDYKSRRIVSSVNISPFLVHVCVVGILYLYSYSSIVLAKMARTFWILMLPTASPVWCDPLTAPSVATVDSKPIYNYHLNNSIADHYYLYL